MKNYSINQVLSDLRGVTSANGKVIRVNGNLGIHNWGKLDFLKRNGYTVIA